MKMNALMAGTALLFCLGCAETAAENAQAAEPAENLDQLIEVERSGGYVKGLGILESGIRERAGDFFGAVLATFKELCWARGYGGVSAEDIERGMNAIIQGFTGRGTASEQTAAAAKGAIAFLKGDWPEARRLLEAARDAELEIDGFAHWMLLVCALEEGGALRQERSDYGAIRARFQLFPEYWYRGARAHAGIVAAGYAEQCINLNPQGPFAAECRTIIARSLGPDIPGEDLLSKGEIDTLIAEAVKAEEPARLRGLFPLISLPDNAYTGYALSALEPLCARPAFRAFFASSAAGAGGRLAERLNGLLEG
ncbi:MAG: hypothetical protein LBR16_04290 [Treponema sp.]|jgi:hypothetical protein|nr:hypothetical protein [Treponema sp.]